MRHPFQRLWSAANVFLLLITSRVGAQSESYVPADGSSPFEVSPELDRLSGWDSSKVFLCNSTIDSANASGIFDFSPNWPNQTDHGEETLHPPNLPSPAWAVTHDVGVNNSIQTSFWYNTNGQNYSDDLAIDYDACAFHFLLLPENTNRLGQEDPGDCSNAISQPCRDVLTSRAQDSAIQWTMYASAPPYSNLSAGVLPYICRRIAADILEADQSWPEECRQDLIGTDPNRADQAVMAPSTLSGYNESILNVPCHANRSETSTSQFHRAFTTWTNGTDSTKVALSVNESSLIAAYDRLTRITFPIMTVLFPVANYQRQSFIPNATATMTCLRARNFSEGSRVSPELPAGTPVKLPTTTSVASVTPASKRLSGGAIAGIVVGVVVGVGLVAGLGFWFFLRRRRQTRTRRAAELEAEQSEQKVSELDGDQLQELHSEDKKVEIDNGQVNELDNGQGEPGELEGTPVQKV